MQKQKPPPYIKHRGPQKKDENEVPPDHKHRGYQLLWIGKGFQQTKEKRREKDKYILMI